MFGHSKSESTPDISIATPQAPARAVPVNAAHPEVAALAGNLNNLANDARAAGTSSSAVDPLVTASNDVAQQSEALLTATPQAAQAGVNAIRTTTAQAQLAFASALLRESEARARQLSASVPWADPARTRGAASSDQRAIAARVKSTLLGLRTTVQSAATLTDPAQTLGAARQALAQSQAFAAATAAAYRQSATAKPVNTELATPRTQKVRDAALAAAPTLAAPAAPEVASTSGGVSPGKMSEFQSIISDARGMASRVIRAGNRNDAAKANAQLARNYDKYLATLKDSMRGVKSDAQADRMIGQAKQTRAYLVYLVQQSGSK